MPSQISKGFLFFNETRKYALGHGRFRLSLSSLLILKKTPRHGANECEWKIMALAAQRLRSTNGVQEETISTGPLINDQAI